VRAGLIALGLRQLARLRLALAQVGAELFGQPRGAFVLVGHAAGINRQASP
jgi:hypothetical protein